MEANQRLKEWYNEVYNLTAVCHSNDSWIDNYPELEIGKIYHVTHIGVRRSISYIILSEFGVNKEFCSDCFEIFENGVSIDRIYHLDMRFWAPCQREMCRAANPNFDIEYIENNEIPRLLKILEKDHNIKILLAVESGSRAWGFESKDSDWDIRFIYVHQPEWYFKIADQRDTFEYIYNDRLDIVGWELKKALTLLQKSNPSILEWFNSPLPVIYLYDKNFKKRISEVAGNYFNPIKLMYHYNHIYNKHNRRYLQREGYPMKRFLYYLRGILACRWIEQKMTLPPIPFKELVEATVENEEIKMQIDELIQIKRGEKECDMLVVNETLVEYAKNLDEYYNNLIDSFRPKMSNVSSDALDSIFYDMVMHR